MTADNQFFTTRIRALSTDQNDQQSLQSRMLLEMMKYSWGGREFFESSTYDSQSEGAEVVVPSSMTAGLRPSASVAADAVVVTRGVLAQLSATHPAAPGALESDYRWGRNDIETTVPLTLPVGVSRNLIEAQVIGVDTGQVRDIWNVGLGVFVPTLVNVRTEYQVQFQEVDNGGGTTWPTPTGDPWVPIMMVHGNGTGNASGPIYYLADRFGDGRETAAISSTSSLTQLETPILHSLQYILADGDSVSATMSGMALDIQFGRFRFTRFSGAEAVVIFPATGLTLAEGDPMYLYMSTLTLADGTEVNPNDGLGNGVMWYSNNPPNLSGVSTVAETLPEFPGTTVPIGTAVCFGYSLFNSSSQSVPTFSAANGRLRRPRGSGVLADSVESVSITTLVLSTPVSATLDLRTHVPINAKSIQLRFNVRQAPAPSQGGLIIIRFLNEVGTSLEEGLLRVEVPIDQTSLAPLLNTHITVDIPCFSDLAPQADNRQFEISVESSITLGLHSIDFTVDGWTL